MDIKLKIKNSVKLINLKFKCLPKKCLALVILFLNCNLDWGQNLPVAYDGYATKVHVGESMDVSFYSPTMFRFRCSEQKNEDVSSRYNIPFTIGHITPWEEIEINTEQNGDVYFIYTKKLKISINMITKQLTVSDIKSKMIIYPSDGPTYGMFKDGYSMFDSASFFNEKNDNSRYSHWFYNHETKLYDIYLDKDLLMDTYFIYGPSYQKIYEQFNKLVGPEPLLPKKAYGFFQTQHLACNGNQVRLMEVAREFQKRDIPVDNLILDFEWGDGCDGDQEIKWGSSLEWSKHYTEPLIPKQMLDSLKAMHLDVMIIQHNAPNFKERTGQGWTETVHPEKLWWDKWKEKLDQGVRGTWQDTRRNDITDSRIWLETQKYIGDSSRVLFLGCRKMQAVNPWDFRYSVTPINNLIGSRRYPFDWTGDCSFNWNELKWQIKAITNSHGPLKGVSYITSDAVGESWQIQARWNQFSDFSTISRSHNPKPWSGNVDVANFQNKIKIEGRDTIIIKDSPDNITHAVDGESNGHTAENSIKKHLKERYKLLPYIYSIAYENYLTGLPICRPMLIAFPDDYLCSSDTWPYQYMFGPNILVAPVYADFKSMEIYLPRGYDWIDYWSQEVYKGGGIINYNTEDVEKLPLFIKAGAIIPKVYERNWIEEGKQETQLILDIYPSKASLFKLFEDDGKSIAYQKGAYSETLISQGYKENGELIVKIGDAKGDFENKLNARIWHVKIFDVLDEYSSVSIDGKEEMLTISTKNVGTGLYKEVTLNEPLNKITTLTFKKKYN